jgi:hypothetical protein
LVKKIEDYFLKKGFFIRITKPWPGEDRLDNLPPKEKKEETPLRKWLNKGG